jgi:hypothetical protein
MTWIDIEVQLLLHDPGCMPEVKVWVDLEPESGLAAETALPLQFQPGQRWVGSLLWMNMAVHSFSYRLGLVAHPGAEFWLNIHDRRLGAPLLYDGDRLEAAKCMLVGTCSIPNAPARQAPRPPQLRLLPTPATSRALCQSTRDSR